MTSTYRNTACKTTAIASHLHLQEQNLDYNLDFVQFLLQCANQMIQAECQKCEDRGETHGLRCIVRKVILDRDFKQGKPHMGRAQAMDAAVLAIEQHIQRQRKTQMNQVTKASTSTALTVAQKYGFTDSQMDLIRTKVAKGATDEELEMFFYQCKMLDANPLMPGEIYFVKFGTSPGTIITGIDTFRKHAHATGKLAGVKRGVIRNPKGECIGGWADVYRTDWKEPAHEEVPMNEYNTGRNNWVKMPETMIKKVAEVAAYRMAFPKQLGGLYVREEMEQAEDRQHTYKPSEAQLKRLFAITKSHGFTTEELKDIMAKQFKRESTKDLTLQEYNDLCALLEKKTIETEKKIDEPQPGDFNEPEEPHVVEPNEVPWAKYRDPQIVK